MPAPIGPIELVDHVHTLTQAADFPMFEKMLDQAATNMRWAVGILSTIIILLVAAMWRSLHVRIGSQRSEDSKKCRDCKTDHDLLKNQQRTELRDELETMWEKIDRCCEKSGVPARDSA